MQNKRMTQTEEEIMAAYPERAKRMRKQGCITFVDCEFWADEKDFLCQSIEFKLPKGSVSVNKWIKESGLERCKKSEAESLLIVGEKRDGCFILRKHKNYWLRPRQITV